MEPVSAIQAGLVISATKRPVFTNATIKGNVQMEVVNVQLDIKEFTVMKDMQ